MAHSLSEAHLAATWLGLAALTACAGMARPAPNGVSASLAVVPPGPVSDRIEVECRLGLRNRGRESALVRASLHVDAETPAGLLLSKTVRVPPGGSRLLQAWWPTTGKAGAHRIHWRVECAGHGPAAGDWPLTVLPSQTSALPFLQAGWLDGLGLSRGVYPRSRDATEQDVRHTLDSMRSLGMSLAIITYVEYQGRFFYPSGLRFYDRDMKREAAGQWFDFDVVEAVLSQTDRNGMNVFLGLGRGGDTHLLWGGLSDEARLREGITTSKQVAAELWERYGHHRSFYGWYISHEADDLAAAAAYYDPVADFCHALAPEKPVMVAPTGTPIGDSDTLARSHVDVYAYQDAVGAGYMPGVYTYRPENRVAALNELYADYSLRHRGTGKHIWADLELWEMAGPGYEKPYAAAFSRVARQIAAEAPHVEMLTGYEVFGFLEPPGTGWRLDDPRAAGLFEGYSAYLTTCTPPPPLPQCGTPRPSPRSR